MHRKVLCRTEVTRSGDDGGPVLTAKKSVKRLVGDSQRFKIQTGS